MQNIILQGMTTEELTELISAKIVNQIEGLRKTQNVKDEEIILTRQEACDFLKIDSSTLWHWTNKGKIKAYGIANKRYYKKHELLGCLKPLKK